MDIWNNPVICEFEKYEKNLSSEKYHILKEGFEEGYNMGGYGEYKTHIYETLKKILHNTKRRLKLTSKEKKVYDEGFKVGQEVRERHDEIIGVLFGIYNSDSSLLPKTLIEMIEGKRFCDFQKSSKQNFI